MKKSLEVIDELLNKLRKKIIILKYKILTILGKQKNCKNLLRKILLIIMMML